MIWLKHTYWAWSIWIGEVQRNSTWGQGGTFRPGSHLHHRTRDRAGCSQAPSATPAGRSRRIGGRSNARGEAAELESQALAGTNCCNCVELGAKRAASCGATVPWESIVSLWPFENSQDLGASAGCATAAVRVVEFVYVIGSLLVMVVSFSFVHIRHRHHPHDGVGLGIGIEIVGIPTPPAIVSPWGLDKAALSLCAAKVCRLLLAEAVRDEVEENLWLHIERLPSWTQKHSLRTIIVHQLIQTRTW